MMLKVRRATAADAGIAGSLSCLCSPRYREDALAWTKAVSNQDGGYYVAEKGPRSESGEPIVAGYGRFAPEHVTPHDSPRHRIFLGVHPESRRQGIGSALLDRMLSDLRALGSTAVRARIQSNQDETSAFLTRRGFTEYDRKVVLELSLTTLETAAVDRIAREHAQRLASAGICIWCLADWSRRDPCWADKLLPVYNAVGHDVPQPDPYNPVTMDELLRFLANPELKPEGFFVAIHEGDMAGFSYLLEPKGEHHVIVGMTGVLPKLRRLGIATALKMREIQYAGSKGVQTMVTGASANNVASIAVNGKMGFRPTWEEVRLEKRLDRTGVNES